MVLCSDHWASEMGYDVMAELIVFFSDSWLELEDQPAIKLSIAPTANDLII